MHYKEIDMFLAKKTLFYIFLFILWSSLAMSFSVEDDVRVVSNDSACVPANYEDVLERIANFESYKHIDDEISWSNMQPQWLSGVVDMVFSAVISRLLEGDIKPLDMVKSFEFSKDAREDELKRSRVWMSFSPLQLPEELVK